MSTTKLFIATSAILLMAAALAANDEPRGADATIASVAALKSNLGNPEGLEVEEVRVTGSGVACIDYRMKNNQGVKSLGHAVVQRDEVLKSSSDYERFEKAWNEHCLGPRGGMTSEQ